MTWMVLVRFHLRILSKGSIIRINSKIILKKRNWTSYAISSIPPTKVPYLLADFDIFQYLNPSNSVNHNNFYDCQNVLLESRRCVKNTKPAVCLFNLSCRFFFQFFEFHWKHTDRQRFIYRKLSLCLVLAFLPWGGKNSKTLRWILVSIIRNTFHCKW